MSRTTKTAPRRLRRAVALAALALAGLPAAAQAANPFGYLDSATSQYGGQVTVRGWTADPDSKTRVIDVHVWIDPHTSKAKSHAIGKAALPRPDVEAAFPGYGRHHGFETTIYGVPAGNHQVCAYGIDYGPGDNTLLQTCKNVSVKSGDVRLTGTSMVEVWQVATTCARWAFGTVPTAYSFTNVFEMSKKSAVKFVRSNALSYTVKTIGCTGLVLYKATPHQSSAPPSVGLVHGGCDVEQARAMGFKPELGDCGS